MDRRKFLVNGSLSLCALGLSKTSFAHQFKGPVFRNSMKIAEGDRVLVMIRLNGGNDGLNTVIPIDQYENLLIQRPDIILPENSLLSLPGHNLALHPKMVGMQQLFEEGELAILQNVDAPSGRSHFRSKEIWSSGIVAQAHPESDTGWLGRLLDIEYPGFPDDYPNDTYTDPFAITFNTTPSATCEGHEGNFAHPVVDPSSTANIEGGFTLGPPDSYQASHIEYLRFLGNQTNDYNVRISDAAEAGNSMSSNYGEDDVSIAMQNIAKLISGGLQSRIYVVEVRGFDTHSNQVNANDVTEGRHAELWENISRAIKAFQEDMHLLGLHERVLGLTFSEFGRQIAQNGSLGTDHGDAACMFMFGSCLGSQVIGNNPEIADAVNNNAGLEQEIDYRDVYSTVLRDWFGLPESDIPVNFEDYGGVNYLDFLSPCSPVTLGTIESEAQKDPLNVTLYPNPTSGELYLKMSLPAGNAHFSMVNIQGRLVGQFERNIPFSGEHKLMVPSEELESGSYFLRVRSKGIDKKVRFVIRK